MSVEVTAPAEGKVSIELNWREAEVLLRVLQTVHYGSLRYASPTLIQIRDELVDHFGINSSENCLNYYTEVHPGMVNLYDKTPF